MNKPTQHRRAARQRPATRLDQRSEAPVETTAAATRAPAEVATSSAPAAPRKAPPPEQVRRAGAAATSPGADRPKLKFEPVAQAQAALADDETRHTTAAAPTKIVQIIQLLRRPQGAGIAELMTATGWQAHSVRGALSGTIKTKLKLNVVSHKADGGRVYRIVEEAAA